MEFIHANYTRFSEVNVLTILSNNFFPVLLGFSLGLWGDVCTDGFCPIEQILVLSLALSAFTLALQCFLFMILRKSEKVAISTTAVLLWIFSFGSFSEICSRLLSAIGLPLLKLDFYIIPYCITGAIVLWFCNVISKSSFVLKCVKTIVIVFFLLVLSTETIQVLSAEQLAKKAVEIMSQQNGNIELGAASKPDIYYIILDAAAPLDTLQNLYGVQNLEFFEYLKKKGFYIAANSKSNYDRTKFSLSSSLNFNYINYLSPLLPKRSQSDTTFCRLIQKSQVVRSLKTLGYKIVNVRSGLPLTEYNPYADTNIGYIFGNELYTALGIEMTILGGLENYSDFVGGIARAKKSWLFSNIDKVQKIKGPKFVFAHILLPHPPFLFEADGSHLPLDGRIMSENYTVKKYTGQITYTYIQTQKMIDELLALSQDKLPIIIVQSDHGPQLNASGWPYSEAYLKERFGILNAYFLPDTKCRVLYSAISPVNTFRLIFNQYFQTHLPLLSDVSYYAPPSPPYYWAPWHDVRQK
jgi:hypothetical protein